MKYFIRQSVIDLIKKDPSEFRKTKGHIELFFIPDDQVIDPDSVSVGDQKLTEVPIDIEKLVNPRPLGML